VSFQAQSSITSGVATGTVAFATPSFSVSKKQIVGATNLAYLTLGTHDVRVGNTIVVSGVDALLDGVKSVSSYDANRIVYRARDNINSVAATGTVAMAVPTLNVTHRQIAGNYAYLTLGASHGLIKGNTINIAGLGGNFDGNKTVYSVDATRISYVAQENVTLTTLSPVGTASIISCSGSCPTVPAGVVEVAAGHGFSMARTATQVFTWGFGGTNWYSRLGRSNKTVTTPSAVTLPGTCNSPSAITAGPFNGAVTCANNTIATWGYNGYGNLGTNVSASTEVAAPAAVAWAAGSITFSAGENIARVAMNNYGGLALTSTGRLFSWGRNYYRLLGTNSTYSAQNLSRVPVAAARIVPTGGATVEEIHSNMHSSLVLDSAGIVWSWGHAGSGLLGRGAYGPVGADGSRFYRLGVPSTARISRVDTTYYGTVIVMSDESVWTLGSNGGARTTYFNGDGTTGSTFLPARIDLPYGFDTSLSSATTRQLSCSSYHCLVATSNGSIYGWGDGAGYQLVLNSVSDRSTPTLIKSGLTNPRVAAGHSYSLYVDIGASGTGGTVYAWGSNTSRRAIPQAATATLTAFTAVQDTLASTTPSDVVAISAGTFHSVALRANGTLMVWGSNSYGQLGRGDLITAYIFKPALPGGKVAASIHAAANHTLVLATDGTLVGWGYNATGVLGSGSVATLTSPTNVATGHRFRSIDTMGVSTTKQMHTAVGLTTSGAVMTWGANTYGQLGRLDRPAASSGVNFYSAVPVAAQTSDATEISGVDAVMTGGWWSGAYQRVSPELTPSAPLGVAATSPAASTINVSWSPPASPRDLTGYVIHVSRDGTRVFSAGAGRGATSLSLTAPTLDILNGQTHSIVVHAVNDAGEGDASGVVTATPVAVPGVVQNLAAMPLVNGLNVDFDAPTDDGGSQVLDYEVEVVTAVGSTQVALQTVAHPSPASGTDITSGLTAGTSYVVRVRARNAEGYGPLDTSEVVVPGRPTAPRDVRVVSANASLNVTWTAPVSNGGVAISSYVATAYTVGTTTVVGTPAVVTSGTSATITGLSNGSTYDIRVAASHDSTGATLRGLESDTVKGVPGRPTQPTGVAASATASQTLVVTWNKVADVPGITVAGYRLTFVNGTTSSTTYFSTTSCPASTCTYSATGLTNGTNYTISVAGYVAGPSYGLASETVTARAMGAAGAPTVEAETGNESAVVNITAPVSTGGTDITGYTVSVTPTPADAYEATLDSAPLPFTLTGLTNGTTYTVTVKALNAMGESAAGTDTVVPATVPSSPQSVRARPGSIVVTWAVPGSSGGASVTHYVISVTDSDGVSTQFSTATSNPTGTASCTTAGRSCTINSVYTSESPETLTTIPNDMEYRVEVSAANNQGVGDPSSTYVLVSGQPDLPTNVEARGGIDVIELCWTPPAGTLTAYQVDLSRGSYASTVTVDVGMLTSPSWCISPKAGFSFGTDDDGVDVIVGVNHTLTVKATVSTSDYVFGVPSEEVEATPYGLPGAPSIQGIGTTASTATITWSAAAPRGSAVTAYTAYAMPTGESCSWTAGALSCTITNLTGNDTYGFYVEATNTAGVGPPSAVVNATIDAAKPAPTWSAPEMGSSRRLAYTATFDEIIYYRVTFDEVVSGFAVIDGDLANAGTAPGCSFGLTPQGSRAYDISVQCSGTGTLIAQVVADAVVDQSANTGPLSNVNAALVTLYDPSTTSTSSSAAPTTAPTTVAPSTSVLSSTTTIDDDERASAARATTTTATSAPPTAGATTVPGARSTTRTTVDSAQGDGADNELPRSIDNRLPNEEIASPDKLDAGDSTSLERCGFVPGEPVRVYVGSAVVQQVLADASGCVAVDIVIDASKNGRVAVALFAPQSKRGAKVSLSVRGSLTATGSDSDAPLGVALVLVMAGLVVMATRRKKRRPT
jgi:alpha-tubulin suppressor-like RCC1 family protein